MAKTALGRGLGALLGTAPPAAAPPLTSVSSPGPQPVREVPLAQIRPCPFQPRKDFPPESLQELADSIRAQGIVQPLIVRARENHFELIAGERRWRAAQMAGLSVVPVVVREADDASALELALVENLQRENLNPLEEALGFAQLISQFNLTQEQAAERVGKSRVAVTNALRLLKLPEEIQAQLRGGEISVGHAKVLLGLPEPAEQRALARRIPKEGLSVRQTEQLAARSQTPRGEQNKNRRGPETPAGVHAAALQERLTQYLGTRLGLHYREGRGRIEIYFFSDAELNRLLEVIGLPPE